MSFLLAQAATAAPALLGALLVRHSPGGLRVGRIVETEAYTQDDPASHSFRGPTPRNRSMFQRAGTVYVYRCYGVHFCLNVVTGEEGAGEAVLVRALEPVEGLDLMRAARGGRAMADHEICRGPGNVCRALGIAADLDGTDFLDGGALRLLAGGLREGEKMVVSPRVGISKGADLPRRFSIAGHRCVSAPTPSRTLLR